MLGLQNRVSDIKLLKFHVNRDSELTLKDEFSNGGSFQNFEVVITFVTSKRVRKKFQFIFPVLVDPTRKTRQ